jgi:CheY-like chemotaxis protein
VTAGRYVKITLTDTGAGMDKETQQRIFDPFFTTKEMGRGTGLGLASAYGIIKNHGGIIDVSSEKGEGSTFKIYLPASRKDTPIRETEVLDEVLEGNETILLVDDEDVILEVGREMLQRMGYKVYVSKSGREAVYDYKKRRDEIDLVVLDMVMPDLGGGEVFDEIKEINPAVKVLLSSGYSIDGGAAKIMNRGCDGFIQKPFDMRELSNKVKEILRQ